ncbi:MAG: phage tail sheath family protein [Thermoanaerobaculia bacterium]
MSVTTTYPGVYIEEVPSGVRTIVGVATSITAFVGRARKGPADEPTMIFSFGEFERTFGPLWNEAPMGFAVHQYFLNGGGTTLIVRVAAADALSATFNLTGAGGPLQLEAASPGAWADGLLLTVDHLTRVPTDPNLFNITVREAPAPAAPLETLRNISLNPASTDFVTRFLAGRSEYLRVIDTSAIPTTIDDVTDVAAAAAGDDGSAVANADLLGNQANRTGMFALEEADLFNILCLPPASPGDTVDEATYSAAASFCADERAMLIADSPPGFSVNRAVADLPTFVTGEGKRNAAIFYPRILMQNPLARTQSIEEYVPCGAVAGVFARTDGNRGVWKAPAGIEAGLAGVQSLSVPLTDGDNGRLNPLGVNCLRTFPLTGSVVWGARTLDGADALASDWKYIPVRRTALFIEESLYRGLKFAVFEPNDEPLWAQIRLAAGAFMQDLFRKGAFQGRTPREAYLVKCDAETTTQNDINLGVVNVLVGFAPLKPAEFVIIRIQQLAGQVQT